MSKQPIKIRQLVIQNIGSRFCGWQPLETGSLCAITDREPDFVYERVGNFFFAEDSGFVHAYHYVPGSTDGFAGREIALKVKGGTVFKNLGSHVERYKGSLWDSAAAYRAFQDKYKTKLYAVPQCSDLKYRKCPVFFSGYVTQERFDEIAKALVLRSIETSTTLEKGIV